MDAFSQVLGTKRGSDRKSSSEDPERLVMETYFADPLCQEYFGSNQLPMVQVKKACDVKDWRNVTEMSDEEAGEIHFHTSTFNLVTGEITDETDIETQFINKIQQKLLFGPDEKRIIDA